jgi:hypothetical protein
VGRILVFNLKQEIHIATTLLGRINGYYENTDIGQSSE